MNNKPASAFVEVFGNSPAARVIDFFMRDKESNFTLIEIIRAANVTYAALRCILEVLKNHDLIIEVGQSGKRKRYKLNKDNPTVKHLLLFCSSLSETLSPEHSSPVGEHEENSDSSAEQNASSTD